MDPKQLLNILHDRSINIKELLIKVIYDNIIDNEVSDINSLLNTLSQDNVNLFNNELIANGINETITLDDLKMIIKSTNVVLDIIDQANNDKDDVEYDNLTDYINKSPEFLEKFNRAAIAAWKEVLTKNTFITFITEELEDKVTYDTVNKIDITDIMPYIEYDIGDAIAARIKIPEDIYLSNEYLDEAMDLSASLDEVDKIFFKVKNDLLLPLAKDKLKFLSTIKDKKGDEHKIDIDILDIHNREKPFLIVNKKLYLGKRYDEHGDISDLLISKGISDKDVAVIYGHIVNDLAFIDPSRTINPDKITSDDLQKIIEDEPTLIKAYTMPKNHSVTRLAKKI